MAWSTAQIDVGADIAVGTEFESPNVRGLLADTPQNRLVLRTQY